VSHLFINLSTVNKRRLGRPGRNALSSQHGAEDDEEPDEARQEEGAKEGASQCYLY
jgi:hypothetical protein